LNWEFSPAADSYNVYLGDNYQEIQSAATHSGDIFKVNTVDTFFDPGTLDMNKTYYWRVDGIIESKTYQGDIWRFSVLPSQGQVGIGTYLTFRGSLHYAF
jgi:hypothetical protein